MVSSSGGRGHRAEERLEKRYNAFSGELKRVFGGRIRRISVDAGFTCPNRDGTIGTGGCIFCGERGSGADGIGAGTVAEQLERGKDRAARKYGECRYLAYFQAFSNTYAPAERLRELYDQALAVPGVVGLMVGTRPDCLPPEVLDLLEEYARRTYFWLELGLQSPVERTLRFLNRGHGVAQFEESALECRRRGIRVCGHLILGLPGESRQEALAGAELMNRCGVAGVKLHLLHVMRGTALEEMYRKGELRLPEQEEYVELVCDFLERLDPSIVIHRLTGEGGRDLVAPDWSNRKFQVLNAIDAELEGRKSFQGKCFEV